MQNKSKPIGTSVFTYTVTKNKIADNAANIKMSNKSHTFNFICISLVYAYKLTKNMEVYLIKHIINSIISVFYNLS